MLFFDWECGVRNDCNKLQVMVYSVCIFVNFVLGDFVCSCSGTQHAKDEQFFSSCVVLDFKLEFGIAFVLCYIYSTVGASNLEDLRQVDDPEIIQTLLPTDPITGSPYLPHMARM